MMLSFRQRFRLQRFVLSSILGWMFLSTTPSLVFGDIGPTFTARVVIRLCPEHALSGTSVELKFAPPWSNTFLSAEVVSRTVDHVAGIGTFDITLPTVFQSLPIRVAAFCRNPFGLSDASNIERITNCDALALIDTDHDGISNRDEDTNCDNFFSFGDASNPDNPDSDGDGVHDLVEYLAHTSRTNAGSSPRPFIAAGSPFDPDKNGSSNAVVWRPSTGMWFIRNDGPTGGHTEFQFGLPGDLPFVYDPDDAPSDVGVIRQVGPSYLWLFHGAGLRRADGSRVTSLTFGNFGDIVLLGPWEKQGVTSPGVAQLFANNWTFKIYRSDGTVRTLELGGNGDIPRPADYDGDGLFDVAVFRPRTQTTYIWKSTTNEIEALVFGTETSDTILRGDVTGDGIADVSFWEPISGLFMTMKSDNGFRDTLARAKIPEHYEELSLGTYGVDLPLAWQTRRGRVVYAVVDHQTGVRSYRAGNSPPETLETIQWGLPGDAQG